MNSNRKAWAVMLAAYLAGVAIALNQSKVPPAMQVLLQDLHMTVTSAEETVPAYEKAIASVRARYIPSTAANEAR